MYSLPINRSLRVSRLHLSFDLEYCNSQLESLLQYPGLLANCICELLIANRSGTHPEIPASLVSSLTTDKFKLQRNMNLSLTGARPFSASDASDDEAIRRIAHKPDDSANPSSPPRCTTPSMEITMSAPSSPIVGSPPGELSLVETTNQRQTFSLQHLGIAHDQVITDMTRQIAYDSHAIAHLLQQREQDSATIRRMEQAFTALRLDHTNAENDRQTLLQGGADTLIATHQRLLASETAATLAAEISARHIRQLTEEAVHLRQQQQITNSRLDQTQSAVHESFNATTARISATEAAVHNNAQTALHNDNILSSTTMHGFATIIDKT
jgi:hypothetical protein